MNAVLVDLAQVRNALRTAARQAAELLRSLPEPQALVPGLDWTVGQTAAHMVAAPVNYLPYATGQGFRRPSSTFARETWSGIRQVGSQDLTELLTCWSRRPIDTSRGQRTCRPTTECRSSEGWR